MKEIWRNVKLRGRSYGRAAEIAKHAGKSMGLTEGTEAGKEAIRWFAEQVVVLDKQLAGVEAELHDRCREIPYAASAEKPAQTYHGIASTEKTVPG